MDWRSFIAGVIVGWLIELAIDWFYWRRVRAADAPTVASTTFDGITLEEHRSQLQTAEARIQRLEADLAAARDSRGNELAEARGEIERLQAELAASQADISRLTTAQSETESLRSELETSRADAARLVTAQAELERLRADAAEHQACAEKLAAAQTEIGRLQNEVARLQPVEPSDLKRIEGIGPKIEGLLNDAGILTFRQLATMDNERLRMIISQAGERYRLADPSTWPEQARLAAEEKWDQLSRLQEGLRGGRQSRPPEKGGATPL
ncbi:MAG TPA: hypothetical protein VF177_07940 [Anaerolineae bacterium]